MKYLNLKYLHHGLAAMLVCLLASPLSGSACEFPVHTVDEYREGKIWNPVLFIAKIKAVAKPVRTEHAVRHSITLEVERNLLPERLATRVVVQSVDTFNSPCSLPSVEPIGAGERWLIAGQRDGERIVPDMVVSRRLSDMEAELMLRNSRQP